MTLFCTGHIKLIYMHLQHYRDGRRSWWYGSWIYYYLCNQCLSPL